MLLVVGVIVLVCTRLSLPAFAKVGFFHFLAGSDWNPVEDSFGALPFIYGTLVTSAIAIVLAMPVAIGLALFLTEMAPARVRRVVSFFVEILAAIPTRGVRAVGPARAGADPARRRRAGARALARLAAAVLGRRRSASASCRRASCSPS